ncbi:MAG: CBS domain-containing protein [Acidobacteria bacterium]|nr:CBS domain-containing protein [Acidobacteriota bacterium]
MRCQDIMKKPVICCKEDETVQTAALRMRDSNVGFLPVLSPEDRVVGIVTDRDIALRVCAGGLDAGHLPIAEVMTREIIACHPGDDVRVVEGLMARNHKSRILIVDQTGKAAGVISLSDIARHDKVFAADTLRLVSTREVRTH